MSLSNKSAEIQRLIRAFETESARFHDVQFHVFHVTQDGCSFDRAFVHPNHAIMLWQYYGTMGDRDDIERLVENLNESDSKWGVRGSGLSLFGVIEGDACGLFVRMATRAGSLFDEREAMQIKSRVVSEIIENEKAKAPGAKPTSVVNDNPLAVWLNYLLFYLSLTSPTREHASKIDPDPFSLSLLALERLAEDRTIGKADRSTRKLEAIQFRVAVSFPGEKRLYVAQVVDALRDPLGADAVFYDHDYQAQLARPSLDTLLQGIYRDRSDLVVVFLCAEYSQKEWCGLEWRAVRDIIKAKQDDRVMFVRFDDATIDGVFSIDGYIDAVKNDPTQVAKFILNRLSTIE